MDVLAGKLCTPSILTCSMHLCRAHSRLPVGISVNTLHAYSCIFCRGQHKRLRCTVLLPTGRHFVLPQSAGGGKCSWSGLAYVGCYYYNCRSYTRSEYSSVFNHGTDYFSSASEHGVGALSVNGSVVFVVKPGSASESGGSVCSACARGGRGG